MDTVTAHPSPAPATMPACGGQAVAQTLPLPFDDGLDEAVPFVLTAAAHREVLGRSVGPTSTISAPDRPPRNVGSSPEASHVSSEAAEAPAASELLRAQSRALLRSGMPIRTIAAALDIDVGRIEDWTADLCDELARRRRRRQSTRSRHDGRVTEADVPRAVDAPVSERHLAGLVYALADIEDDGVAIVHDRIEPVAVLMDAIRGRLQVDPSRIRVAMRVGADLPVDRTLRETAARLGVEPSTIVVGRSLVPGPRAVELRLDIRDATVADQLRRWRDAELSGGTGLRGWDSNPQTFRLTADCSAS
jgi:hypothetical protein